MSLAHAVAEFLVAWNDELPRKKLAPFVQDLTSAYMLATRPEGRPRLNLDAEIHQMRASGLTQLQIAKRLEIHQSTVSRVLSSATPSEKPQVGKPTKKAAK